MPSNVRDEITYPFLNSNGATVEVWEWISNCTPHSTMDMIIYPGWDSYFNICTMRIFEFVLLSDQIAKPARVTNQIKIQTKRSHYLNQCCDIVTWIPEKKLQWNLNRNLCILIQENVLQMSSGKWRPFCSDLKLFRHLCSVKAFVSMVDGTLFNIALPLAPFTNMV